MIVTARGFSEAPRGFLEDRNANGMAIGIVDPFEMIEVCDEDSQWLMASFSPRKFLRQSHERRRMIQQHGQGVVGCLFFRIVEELQILNSRTSLRGKGEHNLFIQFAEVVHEAL